MNLLDYAMLAVVVLIVGFFLWARKAFPIPEIDVREKDDMKSTNVIPFRLLKK